MKTRAILVILAINLWSCHEVEEGSIDSELIEFIDIFEQEAEDRGIVIDVGSLELTAHFMDIDEDNIVGQCISYSDATREIVIDNQYWRGLNQLEKEYIMMHELGHCVLGRDHENASDQNGNCLSIMQSGTGSCDRRYSAANRNRLLDELFNF